MPTPSARKVATCPADIVKRARRRRGQTQAAFACDLGRSQAEVSRYESGQIDPPGAVLMYCLNVIGWVGEDTTVSASKLAERIRRELKPNAKQRVRAAIWELLDLAQDS